MTAYNPKNVVTDVLLTLERHKIPVSMLDDVLSDIRDAVMHQPIQGKGIIGLSPADYEKEAERILRELEHHRVQSD